MVAQLTNDSNCFPLVGDLDSCVSWFGYMLRASTTMREREWGTGSGVDQDRLGRLDWAWGSWVELIRRARRPVGATRLAAMGRMSSKRSTARRATTSKDLAGRVS